MGNKTLFLNDELYQYLLDISLREADVLQLLRQETANLSTSRMQIAPEQGQLLAFLVKLMGARKTLELGVYTGYSALSVALALPDDGQIIACDINNEWTTLAREFWEKAGVSDKVELRLGEAESTLQQLLDDGQADSFDLAFIDADKRNTGLYVEQCLKLVRKGGLVILDNVLWNGNTTNPEDNRPSTQVIRETNQKLSQDDRVDIITLAIGDGMTLARKR